MTPQHYVKTVESWGLTLAYYADAAGAGIPQVFTGAAACRFPNDSPSPVWGCDQSYRPGSSAGEVGGWPCTRCAVFERNMQPGMIFADANAMLFLLNHGLLATL